MKTFTLIEYIIAVNLDVILKNIYIILFTS